MPEVPSLSFNQALARDQWRRRQLRSSKDVPLPGKLPETRNEDNEAIQVTSSEDMGDPTLHDVLQRHLRQCELCHPNDPPPPFGVKDTRHCGEYYEIIQEYSDYERDFVQWGNP